MASKIIISVALLFLMMIPGIILKKCNMVGEGFGKGISNLILYIASPAMILVSFLRPFDKEILVNVVQVFVFAVVSHALFSAVALSIFKKRPEEIRKILRFALIFSNAAYMGMPLIEASLGIEAVVYSAVYSAVFNIFVWSVGVKIYDGENRVGVKEAVRRVLLHPVIITTVIGVLIFVFSLGEYFPTVLVDAATMLKNLVAPLSMIIIGIRLAETNLESLRKMLFDRGIYILILLRQLVFPLAIFGILKLLSFILPISEIAIISTVILSATPVATATSMFAEKFDCDAGYASRTVTVSTLLSVLSMPLVILITGI